MKLKKYIDQNKDAFYSDNTSKEADKIFAERLMKELHKPKNVKVINMRFISVAASIIIVFSALFIYLNNEENTSTKNLLVANLNNDSAGTRLEAVYEFDDSFTKEDDQIIELLLDILHNDSNANVRIATIDALLKFSASEKIRSNLLLALEQEKTPLVQIKLIKSLSELRENRAQKPLQKLIDDKETLPIVTSNASLAMANIEGYNNN